MLLRRVSGRGITLRSSLVSRAVFVLGAAAVATPTSTSSSSSSPSSSSASFFSFAKMGSQATSSLKEDPASPAVVKSDAEWKKTLPNPLTYEVTRHGGTERAGTGIYTHHDEKGTYKCVCCGADLFTSVEKFDSHCGWPAFYAPAGGAEAVQTGPVRYLQDKSHGMIRTEARCRQCEAHLGHVFDDGPAAKGGLRYCINSVCLTFDAGRVARGTAGGGGEGDKKGAAAAGSGGEGGAK